MNLLLWGCAGLLFFTYVGYPAAILLQARFWPRPARRVTGHTPFVTCIVAAHDAGPALGRKIQNLLDQDYPADRLEVIVADDASSDGSPEEAVRLRPERVSVVSGKLRSGKPASLVRAVAKARGSVLVMCDTRQRFDVDAVRELCACLAEPDVGAVTGKLLLEGAGGVSAYWKYETALRRAEGLTGSVAGVTGAIYAIRRELFPLDMPAATILDDVYVPLRVALAGRRVAYSDRATAHDPELQTQVEMVRKVRTLAGNWQLPLLLPQMFSFRNPLLFRLVSHKLLRLAGPFALAGALLGALRAPGLLAGIALLAQLGFYGAAGLEAVRPGSLGRPGKVAFTFVSLNLAAALGLWQLVSGRAQVTWDTTPAPRQTGA